VARVSLGLDPLTGLRHRTSVLGKSPEGADDIGNVPGTILAADGPAVGKDPYAYKCCPHGGAEDPDVCHGDQGDRLAYAAGSSLQGAQGAAPILPFAGFALQAAVPVRTRQRGRTARRAPLICQYGIIPLVCGRISIRIYPVAASRMRIDIAVRFDIHGCTVAVMGQLSITMNLGGMFTPLSAEGYALPPITAKVDGPDIPYILGIAISVVHGQPVCTQLTAEQKDGGPPVTRRGLNSLPVDQIVRAVAAQGALHAEHRPGAITYSPVAPEEVGSLLAELAPRRGRRSDPGAKHQLVERVVQSYRDLLAAGVKQPKPTIAKELSISPSYVGSLLAEARRKGLLGAAVPGCAGEELLAD
jgi:hypothetical protein